MGKFEDNLKESVSSFPHVGLVSSGLMARALTHRSTSPAFYVLMVVKICLCLVPGISVKMTSHEDNSKFSGTAKASCLNPSAKLTLCVLIFFFIF